VIDIKEHMEVIGADGVHVGTVDKLEGNRIKLTKKDSGEGSHKGSITTISIAAWLPALKAQGTALRHRRDRRHAGRRAITISEFQCRFSLL
jgi:hypothetical protein